MIEQLDRKLKPFSKAKTVLVPEKGWINTVRTTLNMTLAQLGKKLHITRQGVKKIEESEANGTISIKTLKEVAAAMDMQLVYSIVPNDSTIEQLVKTRAERLAQKIVMRTHQSMKLEHQEVDEKMIKKAIKELSNELFGEVRKTLWD